MICAGLAAGGKDSCQTWINSQISSDQPGFVTFSSSGTDSDLSVFCTAVVCGSASTSLNSRVGGGSSLVTAGLWPWIASLQTNGAHVCGGTLVAVDSVMSDASCFSSGSNPNEVTLNVINITMSNVTGKNVAILRLASQPLLSDYIQPICVDKGTRTFSTGTLCWVAGWATAEEVLQEFQTSVVECVNVSSTDNICTGAVTLLQGNAGGPLMCKQGNSWFQTAVLTVDSSSNTTSNNSTNKARWSRSSRTSLIQVFTKTSRFQNFLAANLGTFLSPTTTTTSAGDSSGESLAHSSLLLFSLSSVLLLGWCWH
ncbi:unnamed protein product [Coregonus sp. 'balchen']|nr:unnamed protein product [Coregonus sp. 'balchen']